MIATLAPEQRLSRESRQRLQAAVDEAAPALEEARRLADLPTGRFPIAWTRDGISTLIPHVSAIRAVANLLVADAILESEAGNADAALVVCRAILNAGRSIGDEPAAISQRRRMDIRETACRQLERALAHGQPAELALVALQNDFEREEKEPVLLFGLRGERARRPVSLCG